MHTERARSEFCKHRIVPGSLVVDILDSTVLTVFRDCGGKRINDGIFRFFQIHIDQAVDQAINGHMWVGDRAIKDDLEVCRGIAALIDNASGRTVCVPIRIPVGVSLCALCQVTGFGKIPLTLYNSHGILCGQCQLNGHKVRSIFPFLK